MKSAVLRTAVARWFAVAMLVILCAVVPQTAVLADRKGTYVYIIGPDMKVARRDVRVADTTSNGVVIASGLEGHEQIVVTAGAFLREGETVRTTT